jgi:hypothetical protein
MVVEDADDAVDAPEYMSCSVAESCFIRLEVGVPVSFSYRGELSSDGFQGPA